MASRSAQRRSTTRRGTASGGARAVVVDDVRPLVSAPVAGWAAYLAGLTNLLAAAAMLFLLRPGMPVPGSVAATRLEFLTAQPLRWTLGWLTWNLAAIALLAFYVALAGRFYRYGPVRCGLAVAVCASGMAVDLGAQSLYVGLAPRLNLEAFERLEWAAALLTAFVGNGMYTLAGALLTSAGASVLPRPLVGLGALAWCAGAALSATTLASWPLGQMLSTAALMPLVVLWAFLVGRWLLRRAS